MPEYRVPVDCLRVGVFIRLELGWFQHPFSMNRFKIKSRDQIDTLRKLGITTVICVPEKSDQLPLSSPEHVSLGESELDQLHAPDKSPLSDALWTKKKEQILQLQATRRQFKACENQFRKTLDHVKNVMGNLKTTSEAAVYEANHMIGDIVSSLLEQKDIVIHLMNSAAKGEEFYYHSLNTSVLAMILGKECGLDAEKLQKLGLGLLFHDIGKTRIEKRLFYKQTPLTQPELKLVQLHPQYGHEMLSRMEDFLAESMEIITSHHETINGKGYPQGLGGEQIPTLVRIASIANAYDNHCNKLDVNKSLTPYQALSFMFGRQKDELDTNLLAIFVRTLGIYPPGTIVELSTGSIGIVVSTNSSNSLRPSVLLYDPTIPKEAAVVFDMEEDPEVSVVKSLRPNQLSREVYEYLDPRTRVTYFIDKPKKA